MRVQPVDLLAEMRRFGRRVGKRNRPIKGDNCVLGAAEFLQKGTARAMEVEIACKLVSQRFDQRQRGGRAARLQDGNRATERDDREGCKRPSVR